MKKSIGSLIIFVFFISGCSFLEETNNTLNYINETTEYLNELSTFVEETSTNLNEMDVNADIATELESSLVSLEETVTEYNNIEVPSIAEGIHDNISSKNEQLLNTVSDMLEDGNVALEQLENSEIYQTIEEITRLKNQLEDLGIE